MIEVREDVTNKLWRLQNLYKIRTKNEGIVLFRPNDLQKNILSDIEGMNPVRHFTLKSRQVGLSTLWLLYWLDDTMFNEGRVTGILAHKLDSIQHLSSIVTTALSNLPGMPVKLMEDNKTRITFDGVNSTIIFALEIRSSPLHNLHISEWCFCDNQKVWATVGASSKWTNITGETTGNGIGNDGYVTYMDGKTGKNGYKTRFIPWYEHEEYRLPMQGQPYMAPDKRERLAKLDQEQIHFRRQQKSKLKNAFFVEYPETEEDAFAQSGANFFENRKIVVLAKEAHEFNAQSPPSILDEKFTIWEEPKKNHVYVLGGDVAEGIGQDFSAFKILCKTCRQEAMAYKAHVGLDTFYSDIDHFGRLYNNALVGIERNNHGHSILLGLDEICHYPNIFSEEVKQKRLINVVKTTAGLPLRNKPDSLQTIRKLGWHTTQNTKIQMCDQIKIAIEGNSEEDENNFEPEYTIRDVDFLNECLTFQKDGAKLGAVEGKNDDTVIAAAIAYQMYLRVTHKSDRENAYQKVLISASNSGK